MTPFSSRFKYFFRKYPLFRAVCWIIFGVSVISASTFVSINIKRTPEIISVNPPTGSPGDIIALKGKKFGSARDSSFVEIGGERLTSSSYLSWNNNEIKIVLPPNVQNGLIIVDTSGKRSKPAVFVNQTAIPVAVPPNPRTSFPIITSLSADTVSTGQVLILTGTNFGDVRGNSNVFFRTSHTSLSNTDIPISRDTPDIKGILNNYIAANTDDYDYEYWSDTEIHVRIPDGAVSGNIYIHTEKGNSPFQKIQINTGCGTKNFSSGRTYLIQITTDISNAKAARNSSLTLHIPRPVTTASQPKAEMTECTPSPVLANYHHTVIQQADFSELEDKKKRFSQNFMVAVYSIETQIDENQIKPFEDKKRLLYTTSVQADTCVPSDNAKVKKLAAEIIQKEQNPYRQARLIYDYLLHNYQLLSKIRTGDISVPDMIESRKGDAYDFAVLYTALLRSVNIPSKPISGILVDAELKTKNHWWSEFYLENFGWVPVDPALGAGLEFKPFRPVGNPADFYFGNLDSQHIAFSTGWDSLKPSLVTNRIVQRPRSYALQTIWEEASVGMEKYSSYWSNPSILGVY